MLWTSSTRLRSNTPPRRRAPSSVRLRTPCVNACTPLRARVEPTGATSRHGETSARNTQSPSLLPFIQGSSCCASGASSTGESPEGCRRARSHAPVALPSRPYASPASFINGIFSPHLKRRTLCPLFRPQKVRERMTAQLRETQRRLEQSVPYSAVVKSQENERLRLMLDAAKAAGSAKHVDQLLGAALDTVERLTSQVSAGGSACDCSRRGLAVVILALGARQGPSACVLFVSTWQVRSRAAHI